MFYTLTLQTQKMENQKRRRGMGKLWFLTNEPYCRVVWIWGRETSWQTFCRINPTSEHSLFFYNLLFLSGFYSILNKISLQNNFDTNRRQREKTVCGCCILFIFCLEGSLKNYDRCKNHSNIFQVIRVRRVYHCITSITFFC